MAGWLGDLLVSITKSKTRDFVLTPDLGSGTAFDPDNYVSVRMVSMCLPNTRDHVVERLYAVVHGFVTLPSFGGEPIKLAAASMPAELAGVSPDHLDRVISLNKLIAGPTPYIGGEFNLQIGLFSVVQENLAATFLTTVTDLSGAIGTGFAAAAAPYVGVLQTAMKMLSGASGHVRLEVGLDETYKKLATGTFALVAVDSKEHKPNDFSIDAATNRLVYKGQPYVDAPYIIFAIESSDQRPDWGTIPEIATAYKALQDKIKDRNAGTAAREEALAAFRVATLLSPDLVPADASRLIKLVTARTAALIAAMGGGGVAALTEKVGFAPTHHVESEPLPDLASFPLYAAK